MKLAHEFVDSIPEELEDGVLYVSIRFGTVVHKCACGCGEEVVTPLGPAEWRLTYDGRTVSLAPSIGNWSFACRSHYWIEDGKVRWARGFSGAEVARVRQTARMRRETYYLEGDVDTPDDGASRIVQVEQQDEEGRGVWRFVWNKIRDLRRRRERT